MASEEYPSAKKEPPWLPILPPMPRVSVSTNSRARLSHRRPVLLSPPTPTPLPPPLLVVPSPPSPFSPESPASKSSERPILEAFRPPSSTSRSRSETGPEGPWPAPPSSSAGLECFDSTTAPAAKGTSDAVSEPPVNNIFSLSDDKSSGNRSSLCAASEFMPPPNSEGCIVSANGLDSSVSFPIPHISSPPAALKQKSYPCEDVPEAGVQENAAGFLMGLRDGVNEVKDPDCGKPNSKDGCTPSDMEIALAKATSSASCLHALVDVDGECRGADIRVNQETCLDVGGEAEDSDLVKKEELVLDEGELQEEQLPGDRGNEAKDPDFGKPCKDVRSSSDMEFTVVQTTSSLSCLNALEDMDELKGDDTKVIQENSSAIGREDEISDFVKNEELVPEEGELEEGQLPGEWSGQEEPYEDPEPARILESSAVAPSSVVRGVPGIPKTVKFVDQIYYPFQVEEVYSEQRSRGSSKAKGKKKKKHKKGEGSKKRSREKSKEKHNEVLKKRRIEGKGVDGVSNRGQRNNSKDCSGLAEKTRNNNKGTCKLKNGPDNVSPTKAKKPTVDEGPEDGEILLESTEANNGILSSLVEAEVGLWTTDDVDDKFVTEMEEDGAVKKKRGPETAERKLKRKIAKRKKRAQKERELGIRRPPRTVQSKPVKVLCTHYMKGRCAKGDQCTFSHDAVPLTKLEPCKFLMSHSCLKGDDCPYSHDLRAFPCKFFHTRGLCYDGVNCQFSHGAISEEALEKLKQRVEKEKKERISNNTSFDIPTPSFSTPLPPELDPDPLGWGTPSLYPSSHEEQMLYTNHFTSLDQSNLSEDDFNLQNHTYVPPAVGMISGQSIGFPSAIIDRTDINSTDVSPPRIEEEAKEYNHLESNNIKAALESGNSMDLRKSKLEAESSLPGAASTEGPDSATMPRFFNQTACSSPPNERSNAREVLEVPWMEEQMDAPQSLLEDLLASSNEPNTKGALSVTSCFVSPSPAKVVVPLLRRRQHGSLAVDHEKGPQCPVQAVVKRQHTVESLLDEALRQ